MITARVNRQIAHSRIYPTKHEYSCISPYNNYKVIMYSYNNVHVFSVQNRKTGKIIVTYDSLTDCINYIKNL